MRDLLKDPAVEIGAAAEALLFAAARAELVRRGDPARARRWAVVVSDRFLDSSLAYQGPPAASAWRRSRRVNELATGGLVPDLTCCFELDADAAAGRAGGEADRFEDEGAELQERGARGLRAAGGRRAGALAAVDAAASPRPCTPT